MFFLNNEPLPADSPKLALYTHAFKNGDGLLETIRIYKGKPLFLDEHLRRLFSGMYFMKYLFHEELFQNAITSSLYRLIQAHSLHHARVRIQVFRQEFVLPAQFIMEALPIEDYFVTTHPYALTDYFLIPQTFSPISGFKVSNRLGYQMAAYHARENGFDEAVLYNGIYVADAANSNVFIVRSQKVYTPPLLDGGLNGIMRAQVMLLCEQLKIVIKEKHLKAKDLAEADEVFLTNSLRGIIPVGKYNTTVWEATSRPFTTFLRQNLCTWIAAKYD